MVPCIEKVNCGGGGGGRGIRYFIKIGMTGSCNCSILIGLAAWHINHYVMPDK